jgi:hypothetical protein
MRKRLAIITLLATGFVLLAAAAPAMELEGVEIHGFASQGFIKTTKENNFPVSNSGSGSFNFNDFAVNFSKELVPGLRVGLQLLAMDRGSYGKDKVTLDWAYGDYRLNDWLGFRAGKIKVPLGLYNESRDNDALRTFIFLPQNEYYEYERDSFNAVTGGSIYGSVPLGGAGTVNYQLQVGTFPIAVDGGSAKNYSAFISTPTLPWTVTDVNSDVSVVHHLEWRTPVDGLRTTFSGLHTTFKGTAQGTDTNTGTTVDSTWKFDKLHRYIFGVEYTYKDLILASEYQLDDYTVSANYIPDPNAESFSSKQSADGWYVSATYRFTDWLEAGSYYHETYADRHHRDGSVLVASGYVANPWNAWQKDTALTVRFDPMPHLVLKLEGHLEEGTWLLSETSGAEKKNWFIFVSKATVTF